MIRRSILAIAIAAAALAVVPASALAIAPPDVSVAVFETSGTAPIGTDVNYTFIVANGGSADASNVSFTGFNAGTSPVTIAATYPSPTQGTCDTPSADGTFTCDLGTIHASSSVVITLREHGTAIGAIKAYGVAAFSGADPTPGDNVVMASTRVTWPATTLGITVTPNKTTVTTGGRYRYTVVVHNTGANDAHALKVCLRLPLRAKFLFSAPVAVPVGRLVCWKPAGVLAASASRSFSVSVRARRLAGDTMGSVHSVKATGTASAVNAPAVSAIGTLKIAVPVLVGTTKGTTKG